MTRHQRRKLAAARKATKDALFISRFIHEKQKAILEANLLRPMSKRSPRGLGNRGIYMGMGLYPAPGYGTGAFKDKPLGERALRELRSSDKR